MKWFFRIFFKTVRLMLAPVMLVWERTSRPQALVRAADAQQRVDQQTRGLVLYQFKTCPFCIRVRRVIHRLSLNIETRDAQHDEQSRDELLRGGGEIKVPCLRIAKTDGSVTWMYESADIIDYLERHFAPAD